VREVAGVGGRIIVSPNTCQEVVRCAVALKLDPAPGFATASEAFTALEAGAKHLKLFPAVTYGPGHVKQLKAVLPAQAVVWAVGGVGPQQMADWWAAGCRAFGLGGELYRPGQDPKETAEKARRVVAAARALG
jgi:2-dehydro-3-deoxyphosphogalactonate aldolase